MITVDVLPPLSIPENKKLYGLLGMVTLMSGLLIGAIILSNVFSVDVVDTSPPSEQTIKIAWNADSTSSQTPSGRTCDLVNAIIDTTEKNEGTGSMKVTFPDGNVQGDMGCFEFGQTNLGINWNSGDWLCQYFDMKIDSGFNWNVNQNKIKMQRMVQPLVWTMYLNDNSIDISECPGCNGCEGGDKCSVMDYDFTAGGPNPVTNWQSYTVGVKLATGGSTNGQMKLWVNGVLKDSITNQKFTSSTNQLRDAWGTFAMSNFPQSPDGTIWHDDFILTTGPDQCVPRS